MIVKRHQIAFAGLAVLTLVPGLLLSARAAIRLCGLSIARGKENIVAGYVEVKLERPSSSGAVVYRLRLYGANADSSERFEQLVDVSRAQFDRIQPGEVYRYSPVSGQWFVYSDDPTIQK